MKKVVKLHATASTNDVLRYRFRESELPNLYTVWTSVQTDGKGQRGASWDTEPGTNLMFSTLYENNHGLLPFDINKFISVAFTEYLIKATGLSIKIKWPNDILSGAKKIGGILIENIFRKGKLNHSIIGIGLNVNQEVFPNLPRASSLQNLTGVSFESEILLHKFLKKLENLIDQPELLVSRYEKHLYKYLEYSEFTKGGKNFAGKVLGTDTEGKLILAVGGEKKAFELKEVQWIY